MNNNNIKLIAVEQPETEQTEKGNGAIKEMKEKLSEAIKKRDFSKYYEWLGFELPEEELLKKKKRLLNLEGKLRIFYQKELESLEEKLLELEEKSKIICDEQLEIFKDELGKFVEYYTDGEFKNKIILLFEEEFTENNPIIQCKIFEGLLEGIFLNKEIEMLKKKLEEKNEFRQIDNWYSQQQEMRDEKGDSYKICFTSFVMLIKEIAREHEITVINLLNNFSPTKPLEIKDKNDNLIDKLDLHGRVDTIKKPKLLIALIIRAIWKRVEKIDKRFTSMYPLPLERYPKVTDPKNIIEKIKNIKNTSIELLGESYISYIERWLNYLKGRQKIMETMLKVAFSYKSLGGALGDLEEEARSKNVV